MKKLMLIIVVLIGAIGLSACKGDENKRRDGVEVSITQPVSKADGTNDKGEVKYKKENVTETFIKDPKRIASFALGIVDIFDFVGLEKLGIEKLAIPFASLPERLNKYANAPHINGGTLFEIDHDALKLFRPDLIILDGRTASQYEDLKAKYPYADILDASQTTYSLAGQKKIVENLGKIFTNGSKELTDEMTAIEASINQIKAVAKDHEALFIMSNGFNQSKIVISVSGAEGRYGALHTDFGFKEAAPGGNDQHGLPVSLENLDEINPAVIFIMDRAAVVQQADNPSSLTELKNAAIFKGLDASKNGHVYVLEGQSWYTVTGGFTSTKQMIADINQYINKLAN